MPFRPGTVVLLGSGETSASGRAVMDWLFRRSPPPIRVAVLETPAGFEVNSPRVAGRVADFIRDRLQNHSPQVSVVPARKRGTAFSPDDPDILRPLREANVIVLGPGSPTYAARQLQHSLAWHMLVARHRLGADIVLSSAAAIAASQVALPVYEIYKVGEDLFWHPGLDFFGDYGLPLVVVPHWNNREGGEDLDTSRCYMGRQRFESLRAMLPPGVAVVGIDEHTSLILDLSAETCRVMGRGTATLIADAGERRFAAGTSFPIAELGPYRRPDLRAGLPRSVWAHLQPAADESEAPQPPAEVEALKTRREAARARRDWAAADRMRQEIADRGWRVIDTAAGPVLEHAGKR